VYIEKEINATPVKLAVKYASSPTLRTLPVIGVPPLIEFSCEIAAPEQTPTGLWFTLKIISELILMLFAFPQLRM
jgi:hypothetical protein